MWDSTWEKVFKSKAWGKYPAEDLIRFIAKNYYAVDDRKKIRILEIGCGPGANLWFLAREGFSFVGIDGSQTAINQAEERLNTEIPDWKSRGKLIKSDFKNINYQDCYFDSVIDNEAVYCNSYQDSTDIYSEVDRVLVPGGKLFVRTFSEGCWGEKTGKPAGQSAWFCDEGPLGGKGYSRFTKKSEIRDLLANFENIEVELLNRTVNNCQHNIKEWIITASSKE
jgi:ubiquinone/menaquinone biosynthesis C-methylase UbiE